MTLVIESINEVRALLRTITAAKFTKSHYDTDVLMTPFLKRIIEELSVTLLKEERNKWGEKAQKDWEIWIFLTPDRREWEIAKKNAVPLLYKWWPRSSEDQKAELIELLLLPFKLTPELFAKFNNEINELCQARLKKEEKKP